MRSESQPTSGSLNASHTRPTSRMYETFTARMPTTSSSQGFTKNPMIVPLTCAGHPPTAKAILLLVVRRWGTTANDPPEEPFPPGVSGSLIVRRTVALYRELAAASPIATLSLMACQ